MATINETISETDKYYTHRVMSDRFWADIHVQMVDWLRIEPGSQVVDAGCGGGGISALLANKVGPAGSVVALDINGGLLKRMRATLCEAPYESRIVYKEGCVTELPFPDCSLDLAWCSDLIHGLPDPMAGLRELRRVVRPGGRVALREDFWMTRWLPFDLGIGSPGLEYRLDALYAEDFAHFRCSTPGVTRYPYGWPQMLRVAGCAEVAAKTFVQEIFPPFTEEQANYLYRRLLTPLHDEALCARLDPQDRETLELITDPDSPHFVFDRTDLYFVSTSTVYIGYV